MERVITLSGNHFERGKQHGIILSNEIDLSLNSLEAKINAENSFSRTTKERFVSDNVKAIKKLSPEIIVEIEGLAQGSQKSFEEIVLLQYRREIIGLKNVFDCTLYANKSMQFVSQTIDLAGSAGDYPVISLVKPEHGESYISFGFAGLLGYLGMNNHIAVGINMVLSDGWKGGVSPYLLVKHLLENCKSSEEATKVISSADRASSRTLTILDKNSLICAEFDSSHAQFTQNNELFHTNHFILDEMKKREKLHPFSLSSSMKRLVRLTQLKEEINPSSKEDMIHKIFSDHDRYPSGICAHSDNNTRPKTVGAVYMNLTTKEMGYTIGNPCNNNLINTITL